MGKMQLFVLLKPEYGNPTNLLRKWTDHRSYSGLPHNSLDPHSRNSMVRLRLDRIPFYLRIVILGSLAIHELYYLATASVKETALLHKQSMAYRSLLRDPQKSPCYLVQSRPVIGLPIAFAGFSVAIRVHLKVLHFHPQESLEIGRPNYGTWTRLEPPGIYYEDNSAPDYGARR